MFETSLDIDVERCFDLESTFADDRFAELFFELLAHHQHEMRRFDTFELIGKWFECIENRDFFGSLSFFFCDIAHIDHIVEHLVLTLDERVVAGGIIWVVH